MDIYELVNLYDQCNLMVEQYGILSATQAHYCLAVYETLKEIVADGDYLKFREWWDTNADFVRKHGK